MLTEISTLVEAFHFHLCEERGLLPRFRPVPMLPPVFRRYELAARELPERLKPEHGKFLLGLPDAHPLD